MLKNYVKIALQNLIRHKGYSFINIAGFAIGMACCLLIFSYIRHELSFDRYHKDVDRAYRIVVDIRSQAGNRVFVPVSPTVAPALKSDYPQVECSARVLRPWRGPLVRREDKFFYEERVMYADPELFDIFTIPFIQGNPRESIARPNTVVISQRMTSKYFGKANPIGEILKINDREFEITGVVRNSPGNTHLKYDLIASLETLKDWDEMSNWHSTMFYTYLKLRQGVDIEAFSRKISRLADNYVGDRLRGWGSVYHYSLQPLSGIHLHSHLAYETEPPGNQAYLLIFLLVGIFILLIACLNFINLSTARAANRAREVGLRKVVGAQRRQLIGQFSGESILVAFLSLGLAMVIASVALPLLEKLTGVSMNFAVLLKPGALILLVCGTALVGLVAGLYPAFVLSSFKPIITVKGISGPGNRGFVLRTVLVIVQFGISAVLMIGTLTMYEQFSFMKKQSLGFEKEHKLVLPLRGGINIQKNFASVKDRFSRHPSIKGVTVSSTVPGRGISNYSIALVGEDDSKKQSMFHMYFDDDFIKDYGIDIVAGRAFKKTMKTDFMGAFIINEAAVKAFGWSSPEEAIGKRLRTGHGSRVNPVIGVARNFHYRGLQSRIEPLIMEFLPWTFSYITISIDAAGLDNALAFARTQWDALWPGHPFEHFFLDADFDNRYRAEEQMGSLFGIFTVLGLAVACLGLLGLAAFTAQQRFKEIGVRKVLGASTASITIFISKQFLKWVALANLIAWPVAYILMKNWLQDFAYRTTLGLDIFLFSGLAALAIAMLTVSYQSIKAATANPVDSLRYE